MATNKAERFIKRAISESIYGPDNLDDHDQLSIDVYFKVCKKLGNPDRWPTEYSEAYHNTMVFDV